jgi:hypothetical protein
MDKQIFTRKPFLLWEKGQPDRREKDEKEEIMIDANRVKPHNY